MLAGEYRFLPPKTIMKNLPKFRSIIGAGQIKEIVGLLNNSPFDENLTLFSFDEMDQKALKKLLFKVLDAIEDGFVETKLENQTVSEQKREITEMMSLVDYPAYHEGIGGMLTEGEDFNEIKAVLYYLLVNLTTCQKRAYLGKFLVGVPVPEEFLMDKEIKGLQAESKELMEYFREEHEILSGQVWEQNELEQQKEEIRQLGREKEQLIIRLKTYQHSGTQTREFREILKATSGLRQVQEEEARLSEKLIDQQKMLEGFETQMLINKQKVATLEEKIGFDVSAEELMSRAVNEQRLLGQYARELDTELEDKARRRHENKIKLEMILPEEGEMQDMHTVVLKLRAILEDLDLRLAKAVDEEKEERLEIFRRQVEVVERLKEELEDGVTDSQEQRVALEISCQTLKQEMLSKGIVMQELEFNDLQAFQERLQGKLNERNTKQQEINNLQREVSILAETFFLLESERDASRKLVSEFEQRFGVQGLSQMDVRLQDLTRQKCEIDALKSQNLEELSHVVQELRGKIAEKRDKLQPLVDQQKSVKQEIRGLEQEHSEKGGVYLREMKGLKDEFEVLKQAVQSKRNETFEKEIQREQLLEKSRVLGLYLELMNQESQFSEIWGKGKGGFVNEAQGGKRLNEKFRSHGEWIDARVVQVERDIQVLKQERNAVRDQAKAKGKQMRFVQNLLNIMKATVKGRGKENAYEGINTDGTEENGGMTQRETFNRLVME